MDNDLIAIKDICDGMKHINVLFIVLELTSSTKTKENREVFVFKVADQSGSIDCSIWGDSAKLLQPGDIVRMTKLNSSIWRGCLKIKSSRLSEIYKLGDFCMVFNEQPNMSDPPNDEMNGKSRFHPRDTSNSWFSKVKVEKESESASKIASPKTRFQQFGVESNSRKVLLTQSSALQNPNGISQYRPKTRSSQSVMQKSKPPSIKMNYESYKKNPPQSSSHNSSTLNESSQFQPRNNSSPSQYRSAKSTLNVPANIKIRSEAINATQSTEQIDTKSRKIFKIRRTLTVKPEA